MLTADEIVGVWRERKTAAGTAIARMGEVKRLYNGDIVVPLPELNRNEQSSIPNRVRTGLDQVSDRIASQLPNLDCPPVRPGIKLSEDRAHDRRRAMLGWWGKSAMSVVLRQRARFMQGYGASPIQVRWDPDLAMPTWEAHNPLDCWPAPLRTISDLSPADCVVESVRPLKWLNLRYPARMAGLWKGDRWTGDTLVSLLDHSDDQWCTLVAVGADSVPTGVSPAVILEQYPNRAERCPFVIPRLVSLDSPHGQFDGMAGMYQTEAMLMALAIIATKKGVFADEWLVARPNENPTIEQVPDSMNGIPGVVKGGDIVPRGVDPQFQTNITIDRLAEAQRMTAGLSSDLSGVSGSNIRTGRRGSQLLSAVLDFPIQHAQDLLALSMEEENRVAVAFAKGYGDGPRSFYVSWPGARGPVTYTPDDTFETDENHVRYSLPGADMQGLTITALQRVGAGTLSKKTWMAMDPMIEDADLEYRRVREEQIETAFWASVQQLAADPQGPWQPVDFAYLARLIVAEGDEPFDAVDKVHQAAQKRQAEQAPTPAEAQPGLSMPGQGVEQPPAIPGASPSAQGLTSLLNNLRSGQRALPQESAA